MCESETVSRPGGHTATCAPGEAPAFGAGSRSRAEYRSGHDVEAGEPWRGAVGQGEPRPSCAGGGAGGVYCPPLGDCLTAQRARKKRLGGNRDAFDPRVTGILIQTGGSSIVRSAAGLGQAKETDPC